MNRNVDDLQLNGPHLPHDKQRVALLVEYHGASFFGSQCQRHPMQVIPTVQSSLEEALVTLNLKTSSVHLAGRTDAGVNARGQVAHFDLLSGEALQHIPNLATALNAILPGSLSVKSFALEAHPRFHSQLDATHRWYRFTILNRPERSALAPQDSLWIRSPLNVERMNQGAQQLLGTHNFHSMKCRDSQVSDDICTISYSKVTQEGDLLYFDIVSNRFLYKMVRNLVGLLISVGNAENPFQTVDVLQMIHQEDRAKASWPTVKPDGLSLMAVLYPEEFLYFQSDSLVQTLKQMLNMESIQDENLFRKAS